MQQGNFVQDDREPVAPRVLLTATNWWPSSARIAMGLASLGCDISAICPTRGHPLLRTRVVQRIFPYSSLHPLESLVAAIEATAPQIIIPCDDWSVQHLHELHEHARTLGQEGAGLADLIEYSLGPPKNYPIVTSRCELLRIAREEGIRVPDTMPLTTEKDLKTWQAEHTFPWVLKGDGTFGGKGVRIAKTVGEAERSFFEIRRLFGLARVIKRALVNRDPFWLRPWFHNHCPAVSVQAYVEGRPANCTFASWKGEVLACISAEVVSSEGQTGPADIVRIVENPEMLFASERISRRLCLSGFYGLDFMIEDSTRATYLIELNPRCTPLSHLQLGKQRDLIGGLASQLSGTPLRETPPVTLNELIAYFPQILYCKSEFLRSSFQDIPQGDPDMVEDLRQPWPNRSLLYRLASKVTNLATAGRHSTSSEPSVPNA
jgi:ATP-grasp domain